MSEHFEEEERDSSPRRVDWSLWRRIAGHLRPYPGPVTNMIGCGLVLAAVEVMLPLVTASIIDEAIGDGRASRIGLFGGIYAIMLGIFAFLVRRFITAAGTLATRVAFDLRATAFARLQSLPFGYFDVRSTGWLVARVTSDVTKVTSLLPWFLLDIGWGSAMLVGIFTAMMLVDPQLGLAVSVIVPPMAMATWWFKRRMLESSRRIRKSNSRITASYTETIAGVRTTRMLAREDAAAAERVQELIEETPAIRDSPEVEARIAAEAAAPTPGVAEDGGKASIDVVTFQSVGHAYVAKDRVLDDVSFELRRGTTLALVGATGSGKTTIAGLLARWYEPSDGQILVDGVDYRQRGLDWWQSQFGVVQQVPHLFSGTVRDNIRYGRLDADDDAIRAALQRVRALDFVSDLEGGLDFEVGEGGGNLSQGQRQLISLARAFLADPQIFIMDEATSSVDAETESTIQAAVDEILRDRIAVVIAHRLSTIRRADLILVLDQGKVVERGSHEELMQARGRYRRLYLDQFVNEEEARLLGGP